MEKKDIYEHLAKIYLDNSAVKKKKQKSDTSNHRAFIIAAVVLVLGVLAVVLFLSPRNKISIPEIALVLTHETVKVNFTFDPAKKGVYYFDLNKANLASYKSLVFSIKKSNYSDNISLRVEFANIYKERSELYVKDISSKWQECVLKLPDFKNITDWTEMSRLSFIIEEWNSQDKKGAIYLDNVRLLK
ncbi:MAG: hypothetical protein PHH68_01620 [Candidatus Omnitrophica bacterium]|jgi:hypothetical protein|nr:hypothetical protein [Candidatus Omnitrophota bacterium]